MNDLDIEGLVGSVLRGVLTSRGKQSHGALRYLAGSGGSSFLNASTLLALGGLAWGLWETAQAQSAPQAAQPPRAWPSPTPGGLAVPPPLPPDMAPAATVVPPIPSDATATAVHPDVLRVLRLTLAAARADGTLEPKERDAILVRAREVGVEPLIAAEIDRPQGLSSVVAGVEDPKMRQDLYTLAFAIVRADEQVTAQERGWLTDLAGQLRIDPATVTALEQQAASRIAAAAQGASH